MSLLPWMHCQCARTSHYYHMQRPTLDQLCSFYFVLAATEVDQFVKLWSQHPLCNCKKSSKVQVPTPTAEVLRTYRGKFTRTKSSVPKIICICTERFDGNIPPFQYLFLMQFNPRPFGVLSITQLAGGRVILSPPISKTTGQMLKIQAVLFNSLIKFVEQNLISLTSGEGVTNDATGQVKVKLFTCMT